MTVSCAYLQVLGYLITVNSQLRTAPLSHFLIT